MAINVCTHKPAAALIKARNVSDVLRLLIPHNYHEKLPNGRTDPSDFEYELKFSEPVTPLSRRCVADFMRTWAGSTPMAPSHVLCNRARTAAFSGRTWLRPQDLARLEFRGGICTNLNFDGVVILVTVLFT